MIKDNKLKKSERAKINIANFDCEKRDDKIRRKLKKVFLKPLKFSRLTLIILEIILGIFLFLLSLNFIFLISTNRTLKNNLVNFQNETNKKLGVINESLNNSSVSNTGLASEAMNSFGDIFSSLVYIDQTKTDMNWDTNTTAFTFPPLYSFTKIETGSGVAAGSTSPLSSSSNLKVVNNTLYYNGQIIKLPAEVRAENILNINVDLIGSRLLVGIVTGKTYDERGWVYFFDGAKKSFTPLITAASAEKIEPKFERPGGTIAFGGTEDNFLIVYGGYDGHAFYYYKGVLSDVSKFFDLRVSAGGFVPEIVSRDNSRGTIFYICSRTEGKPKLIKFWPKQAGELMGSLDFTPLIFTDSLGATSASCDLNEKGILINVKKAVMTADNLNNVSSEAWQFIDNGFDNSHNREVTSIDIGQNRGRKIDSAAILDLDIESDGTIQNGAPNSQAELYFSNQAGEGPNNDGSNWQKITPFEWVGFKAPTTSLFWRATFKAEPGDSDYSPWFDQINRLDYQTN